MKYGTDVYYSICLAEEEKWMCQAQCWCKWDGDCGDTVLTSLLQLNSLKDIFKAFYQPLH